MREKALSPRKAEKQTAGTQTPLQWPLWLPVPAPAWDSQTGWKAVLFTRVEMGIVSYTFVKDGVGRGW